MMTALNTCISPTNTNISSDNNIMYAEAIDVRAALMTAADQ